MKIVADEPKHPPQVLILDDDQAACELLEDVLGRLGYATKSYQEAPAALDALDTYDFDALIVDYRLCGATGVEVCTEAKARHRRAAFSRSATTCVGLRSTDAPWERRTPLFFIQPEELGRIAG